MPKREDLKSFSVQYHPEAAAGPHDAAYLFDRFTQLLDERSGGFEARSARTSTTEGDA